MAPLEPVLSPGAWLRLEAPLNGWSRPRGEGLATQVGIGRHLRVVEVDPDGGSRLRVRLWEDGYPCWLEAEELRRHGQPALPPPLPRLGREAIRARLGRVLAFGEAAGSRANVYLWGGTLGPDYDCSGLVQAAYAAAGIWLPRDAYLQERFCRPVAVHPGQTSLLARGDLLFFGTARRCTHVGLHLGNGRYLHSSGQAHGRNGIGQDDLNPRNEDPVAAHYRGELRGAGRVMHSHDGSPLPP
jgi:hypothetical protein